MTDTTAMTIGAAAKAAGVGEQTLRYYEQRGLISPERGGGGGYRYYDTIDFARVRPIKRAQHLGFTLAEIRELLLMPTSADPQRLASLATAKLDELDTKIRDLKRVRHALARLLDTCHCGGDLNACLVIESIGGETDGNRRDNVNNARRSPRTR
jgi:MerR family mercuric resistance operon transcriptional regulator